MAYRRPTTGVQSPPATGKICDITYYIATNPLRSIQITLRSLRLGLVKLRYVSLHYIGLLPRHLPACQSASSIPTNAIPPLHRCHGPIYLAVSPSNPSIQSPTITPPVVASALTGMKCHLPSMPQLRNYRPLSERSSAQTTYVSFCRANTPHFACDSYTYLQITNSKAYKFVKGSRQGQVIPVRDMNAYECMKV